MKTKINLLLLALLLMASAFAQDYIEIKITKNKNFPNQTMGHSVNSNDTVSSHNIDFHIQNQRLHSILHHFHARKYKPTYSAVYRSDATSKLKASLINELKSIYTIECLNCDMQKLKDTLSNYISDTSFGLAEVNLRKKILLSYPPNDYDLQYGPKSTDCFFSNGSTSISGIYNWHGHLDKIKALDAWNLSTCNSQVKIAICDQWFDTQHPDLVNKYDYIYPNTWPPTSAACHGTSTSVIAAGETNNNEGLSAIGYNARLFLYPNDESYFLNAAMDGIRIVSYSWGSQGYDQTKQNVINQVNDLGTFVIVAAGNGWQDCYHCWPGYDPASYFYPASYDNVFSVTGVWNNDSHKFVSTDPDDMTHQHNDKVDLCAPSHHIWVATYQTSTQHTDSHRSDYNCMDHDETYTHSWNWGDGTSYAAPMVAGTVALMLDVNPCLTPKEMEAILKNSADDIYGVADNYKYSGLLGAGRLNAYKAVSMASIWGNTSLTINNGENITFSTLHYYSNIYVKSGGTLTLSSTDLYIGENGKIVVEPGGKLFVNHSRIMARPVPNYSISGCTFSAYKWQGIEVQGYQSLSQSQANQGFININSNSVIQDAKNAVSTSATDQYGNYDWAHTGGGIIIASNSLFTHNNRHVELTAYHNIVNGTEQNNISGFVSCTFETDETRLTASSGVRYQKMFTNWSTKGIRVIACTFQNTNGGVNMNIAGADLGTGIYAVDASMFIQDKIDLQGVSTAGYFNNLSIGIQDDHTNGDPSKGHIIKKQIFNGDIYGIQQISANTSHIFRNHFIMEYPNGYPSYDKSGYWGISSGGFSITENIFSNSTSTNFSERGSTFYHSKAGGGGLYKKNTHTGVKIGGQTEKENQMLNYNCNGHNYHTFSTSSGIALNPKYPTTLPKDNMSDLPFFGSSITPYDKKNTFSNNLWDINNFTNATKEYDKLTNSTTGPDPLKCTAMNIVTILSGSEDCSTQLEPAEPNGWWTFDRNDNKVIAFYGKKSTLIGDKQPILNGCTQTLLDMIAQGANVPASDLYNALNNASPYLCDNVMTSMLQTSQHLSETQVVNILVSNSKLTQTVLNAFCYRNFSEIALSTINEAQSNISARELQEATVAQDERDVSDARVTLLNYYLAGDLLDTINNYEDSTITFLQNETDELSIKQLVSIYINKSQTSLASQTLALLDQSIGENSTFAQLMNVLIDLKSAGNNIFQLSSEQEQTVRSIAATSTDAAFNARSILGIVYGEYTIQRPVPIDEVYGKRGNSTTGIKENNTVNKNVLRIFPNPASNYATIEYMFVNSVKSEKIIINNLAGATVKTIDLSQRSGQYMLNLESLSEGMYFVELRGNDELISVKKLIVTKD